MDASLAQLKSTILSSFLAHADCVVLSCLGTTRIPIGHAKARLVLREKLSSFFAK
jgi:hypothetical protein